MLDLNSESVVGSSNGSLRPVMDKQEPKRQESLQLEESEESVRMVDEIKLTKSCVEIKGQKSLEEEPLL